MKRILIVGLGSIGKRHLRLARGIFPDADIRVFRHQVYSEIPDNADGCFFELDEAISFKPQIAVIANPAPFHIDLALPLAKRGVHLLVEKPLAASSEGVQRFLNVCNNNNIKLMVGYNMRFKSCLQRFHELLNEGIVGNILSVRCEVGQNLMLWRPEEDYRRTVSAQANLGGGVLLELSHEIDYLRWIFGDIAWVKASCTRQSDLEIDVEDTVHAILGFSSSNLTGFLSMDFIRHDALRVCTVIGDNGSLRWDGISGKVDFFKQGSDKWYNIFHDIQQRDDSFLSEWAHFLKCIESGHQTSITGEDGLAVLRIIEAIKKSSKCESTVYTRSE